MNSDSAANVFGRRLKRIRDDRQISRSELSERSGLSYPYISQLETGIRTPSRKATWALEQALDLAPGDLEGSIPADVSDPRSLRTASMRAESVERMIPMDEPLEVLPDGSPSASREGLIGDMVDLLEEADLDERLDVLAEVQKKTMERMLAQQKPKRRR